MEEVVESIPVSLREKISDKLVSLILDAEKKDAISSDTAKKIIYLWRQDQLGTPAGLKTLLNAAATVNYEETYEILDDYGLEEIKVSLKTVQ